MGNLTLADNVSVNGISKLRIPTGGVLEVAQKNYRDRQYNGYSSEQRALANHPQREERYNNGNNPTICCMTGFTRPDALKGGGYLFTHLEDYRKPLDWYPMSKQAHRLLHRRFQNPKPWLRLVRKHYKHGAWFTLLTMDVLDMYKPYCETYRHGLPRAHELWSDYADELGITKASFE